jgi:hypothetical protein
MDRGKTASWFSGACGAPEIMNVIPGSGLKGHRYCEHVVYPVQPPDVKRGTKTQGDFKAQRRRTLARANPAWRKTTLHPASLGEPHGHQDHQDVAEDPKGSEGGQKTGRLLGIQGRQGGGDAKHDKVHLEKPAKVIRWRRS